LPHVAFDLSFEIDDLLPLVDAAELLGFVTVSGGVIELTPVGTEFTTADIQASKQIFARQARERAPLVRAICKALAASADGNLRASFFLDLLQRSFGPDHAQQQLNTAIGWGRYGELFHYDAATDLITADADAGVFAGAR
jgi:NitT/TauT family transport system ATP-binding protein